MQYKNLLNSFVKNVMIGRSPTQAGVQNTESPKVELVDIVSSKIIYRITNALTDLDIQKIEQLDKTTTGNEVLNYVKERVPNFDSIIMEEIDVVRGQNATPSLPR